MSAGVSARQIGAYLEDRRESLTYTQSAVGNITTQALPLINLLSPGSRIDKSFCRMLVHLFLKSSSGD